MQFNDFQPNSDGQCEEQLKSNIVILAEHTHKKNYIQEQQQQQEQQ